MTNQLKLFVVGGVNVLCDDFGSVKLVIFVALLTGKITEFDAEFIG